MSSLLSLPTLLVLMFFPTMEEWVLFLCVPSPRTTQYTTSAFTSAKTKGMSYFSCRSPSLTALTGAGPQQKTPAGSGAAVTTPGLAPRRRKACSGWGEPLLGRGRDGAPALRTSYLRFSPGAWGPAPATRRSWVPGLDGPSRTPPSSGSSCRGKPGHGALSWAAGKGRAGGAGWPRRAAHQIESLERCSCSPVSLR